MLSADFLQLLADHAVKAAAPQAVDIGDPKQVAFAVGGKILPYDVPAPSRDHHVESLEDLANATARYLEGGRGSVWYSFDAVVAVLNDGIEEHRDHRITFKLTASSVLKTLIRLEREAGWMEQKAFVRLLRIDLAGCMDPVTLLEPVRRVRFESTGSTVSEVRNQRESMGREITSKVDAGAELPEVVTLAVPVFSNPGEREKYPLDCAVEVDAMAGKFRLMPLPDGIERLKSFALADIANRLETDLPEGVEAFMGQP